MKHLVIIGNGFDISLNLQTRFIDFVSNYLSKQNIGNSFLLNHINKIGKDLLWIDMEKELKKLSKDLIDKNGEVATEVEDLANDFELLKKHLINYLNIENKKIFPVIVRAMNLSTLLLLQMMSLLSILITQILFLK